MGCFEVYSERRTHISIFFIGSFCILSKPHVFSLINDHFGKSCNSEFMNCPLLMKYIGQDTFNKGIRKYLFRERNELVLKAPI